MLGIDVPCCHRYKLGAKFPDCPKAKLNIKPENQKLEIIFNVLPVNQNVAMQDEEYYDKQFVINQIRRFSHFSSVDKIKAYVDERFANYPSTPGFILKRSQRLINMISDGIFHFTSLYKDSEDE